MEYAELLKEIKSMIFDNFSLKSTECVFTVAIIILVIAVFSFKSLYTTSIEEVFMTLKEKKKHILYKVIILFVASLFVNIILLIEKKMLVFEIGGAIFLGVISVYYKLKELQTKVFLEKEVELYTFFKNKKFEFFMAFIFLLISMISGLINILALNISDLNCAIIVSVIDIVVFCTFMPELIKIPSNAYIFYDDKKLYLYDRVDENYVLCGNRSDMSDSDNYITISYEHLKGKEIFKDIHNNLSSEDKKKLKKKLNKKFKKKLNRKFRKTF